MGVRVSLWCSKGLDVGWGRLVGMVKTKCGGLSTPQRTVRLSVASVEMTIEWLPGKGQSKRQRQKQVPFGDDKQERQLQLQRKL
jgi:hypothetical protein